MKKLVFVIVALVSAFALMACGSPSAPESPDSEGYGTTIQPE